MASHIQKIISEEIERFVLNEMLSSKCYHFTTLDGLLRILKTNTFLLKTDVVSDTEHWEDKPRYRFFMSTTRVRDGRFGYNYFIDQNEMLVRITLNGDLLNMNSMCSTLDTSQSEISLLKSDKLNMHLMVFTLETSHLDMSPLNGE